MQASNEEIAEILQAQIADMDMIVQGLKNYEPFQRLVDKFRRTNDALNNSWHMFNDPAKFQEARITKYSAMELIYCIENMEADLQKARFELAKLQSPTEMINKDVDNEGAE